MIRLIVILTLLSCFSGSANAQVFHFVDSVAVLNNSTDQDPAHWYIEIHNDISVDTTLRWKATFINMEPQWEINFNDQTLNHQNVLGGDSADFVLKAGLTFPQKLIIGNHLNGTTGNGSVFFEIFDPNFPSYRKTIEYRFNIVQGSLGVGMDEQDIERGIQYRNGKLVVPTQLIGAKADIVSIDGKLLQTKLIESPQTDLTLTEIEYIIVRITYKGKVYIRKLSTLL